jgi:hypothetical protein
VKPTSVIVLGKTYTIEYMDNPSLVDLYKRESCWGQIDYWTRSIRVYDNGRSQEDLWHTIIHEMLHAIAQGLHMSILTVESNHEDLDLLALALTDTFFRNGWIKEE